MQKFLFFCSCVQRATRDSHTCQEIDDLLTCVWASGLWWVITHDLLEWKGIHLSPVRMNAMMNAAARCCLDSPEVRAVTNDPHRGSEDRASFIQSDQSTQACAGTGLQGGCGATMEAELWRAQTNVKFLIIKYKQGYMYRWDSFPLYLTYI